VPRFIIPAREDRWRALKSRRFHGGRALTGKQILDSLSRKRTRVAFPSRPLYTEVLKKNRDESRRLSHLKYENAKA